MKRIFEVTSPQDLQRQIVALIGAMASDHRNHRRFCRTKRELAEYDAIIGILSGLSETIEDATVIVEEDPWPEQRATLLPCPFCGRIPYLKRLGGKGSTHAYVECPCEAEMSFSTTVEGMVAKWNKRTLLTKE